MIETAPYLEDGTPFPTLLYLTCPSAVSEVGGLESRGGVADLRRLIRDDSRVRQALLDLTERYGERRRERLPRRFDLERALDKGAVLDAGIGGPREPVQASCLHAYAAALLVALEGPPQILRSRPVRPSVSASWGALLARLGNLWCMNGWCRSFLRGGEKRAVIDVGTNSVRVLVAEHFPGFAPRTILRQAEVTQLGEGLAGIGRLLPSAQQRTTAAVEDFVREARSLGAAVIVLVATSAAREAADGREYVQALSHAFGVPALVVTGELEARLSYSGATLDVPRNPVFIDPGGGSTELVYSPPGEELVIVSLNLGAVRATDEWIRQDPPAEDERRRVREEARAAFLPWRELFSQDLGGAGRELVGVAGTVTTLACQILGLTDYDAESIHLARVTRDSIEEQASLLASLKNEERARLRCMQRGRERVIVAGADILLAAMEVFNFDCLLVSERDILDGAILAAEELVSMGGAPRDPGD